MEARGVWTSQDVERRLQSESEQQPCTYMPFLLRSQPRAELFKGLIMKADVGVLC